jgi:hypothetical protein
MSTIKITELTSSGAILGNVVLPVVGNIAGTLTTLKATVDQLKTFITAGAEANILAANSATIFANTVMKGYVDLANTIQSAQLTSANIGIIGYVDNAVLTANIGIKGYVDSVASQSIYGNGNVTSYTVSMGFTNFSNVNVSALITTNGLTNYSNVNTKAYAESMGYQNFGNVNVAAYVTTANSAVIGYVDNTVSTANVGMNGLVNAVIDAVNVANIVVTQSIVSANVGMKGYVDSLVGGGSSYGNGNVASYLISTRVSVANIKLEPSGNITFADGTTQTTAASGGGSNYGNANVTAYTVSMGFANFSNVNVKAYSESMGYQNFGNVNVAAYVTTANSAVIGYVNNQVSTANIGIIGYIDLGNTIQSNQISSANLGMKGYVDNAITTITGGAPAILDTLGELANALGADANLSVTLTSYIGNVNANISTANLGMKGYVDSVASQSLYGNTNVSALITTNGLTNYSNVNAKAYTETMGYQNFGNVNVAAYVTTANSAVIGYVDNSVLTANVGMKGYVDAGVIWSISASGTSDYVFSGPGIVAGNTNDPVLYLYKGLTYTFINTTGGSHPFAIRVSNGGADYTSGVSGSQTGTQTFTVPMDAPSTLYYQCTIHGVMGNTIYIGSIDNNYSNVNVKAYTESMGFQNYSNVNVAALITTNGLTNYSNVNVIAYLAGNITVGNIAGSVDGYSIGYRDVPQITVANLTLIASDAGKHYYGANTNPTTITIPTNANVAFGNGTAISIVNQGTGNITVANAAGVSLYLAGNSTAGSRTLTSYGMATLIKVQVNTWFINGSGVV